MSNSTNVINKVPLLDLKAQYRSIKTEIESAIRDVCEEQAFILGPRVLKLEMAIAEYTDTSFAIGVSSGTDALLLALMALGVGPGDEVITTPFTFFATGGVIARLGAKPVYCDINPDTYNLDPASVSRFVHAHCKLQNKKLINMATGGHVKVLMPVHLFGQITEMAAIMDVAAEYDLKVVEDAAQAIGAETRDGIRAGSIGDIGCFSFFPSKNLGAFGDGGICVTQNELLAEKMKTLRVHGGKPKYYHSMIGGNFRLDAIQAAVLLVKLKHLDEWTAGRQLKAAQYDRLLALIKEQVTRPLKLEGVRHVYNQYTLRIDKRYELREHLTNRGVSTEIYYPVPQHLQKCFEYLGYQQGDCPVAESSASTVLSLPVYPELPDVQQAYVVDCIREFVSTEPEFEHGR